MKKLALFTLSLIMLAVNNSCTNSSKANENAGNDKPMNIIFLIGDGMGLSEVSATYYFGDQPPAFNEFQHIGLMGTSSKSHKITDSGASGTALACGEKTYNGAVGVNADTTVLKNIVEIASEMGKSTGVISTSSITHATPASYYAHVKQRHREEEIAEQLVSSPVDFFAGGGIRFFANRKDGKNLIAELETHDFVVDTTSLSAKPLSADKKYGFLLAEGGMPARHEGRGDFLPNATQMALDHLSQDKDGFFLVVEGSQIDWAGHGNDNEYMLAEIADFNKTIAVALEFAKKHENTLLVVTADHETGGFALAADDGDYDKIKPSYATGGHTASLVPVFALGPGAHQYTGIYENSDMFHKMKAAFGE
ncbi:MAG: alkaline phosphatase [Bacteroidales bacterium]|nr:alkaline phosphatase [Bacteroidales bacterium]